MTESSVPSREKSTALLRTIAFFERLHAFSNRGVAIYQAAPKIWHFEHLTLEHRIRETAAMLLALEEQVVLAKIEVSHLSNLPTSDWSDAFTQLEGTLRVTAISHSVAQFQGGVPQPTISVLRVISRFVSPDQYLIDDDDLALLDNAIQDFGLAVDKVPDSDRLGQFLRDQLRQLHRARLLYRVAGSTSLRKSVYELDGAIINEFGADGRHAPNDPAANEAITRAGALRRIIKSVLTWTTLTGGAFKAAQEIGRIAAETELWYEGVNDSMGGSAE